MSRLFRPATAGPWWRWGWTVMAIVSFVAGVMVIALWITLGTPDQAAQLQATALVLVCLVWFCLSVHASTCEWLWYAAERRRTRDWRKGVEW